MLRYIHRNPLKAKLVKNIQDYVWSSYNQYIELYNNRKADIDGELITAYFKNSHTYIEFMNIDDKQQYLDYEPARKYTDDHFGT